jgi:hypothetical protein
MANGNKSRPPIESRARRLIASIGGERAAIPILLNNAWLLSPPTCPELDEPVAAQRARSERMQRIAVTSLRLIYHDQLDRGEVDEGIRRFFAEQMELRVWCTANPIAAMRRFLDPPKRGAPPRTAARDFYLAADIQELIDEGRKVDDACGDVFERLDSTDLELDIGTLRNIYFRETKSRLNKKAIKAELLSRALGELEKLRHKARADGLAPAEEERATQLQAKIVAWQASFEAKLQR